MPLLASGALETSVSVAKKGNLAFFGSDCATYRQILNVVSRFRSISNVELCGLLRAIVSCEVPFWKCLQHAITLVILTRKEFGIGLHSLTAAFPVKCRFSSTRFKNSFWSICVRTLFLSTVFLACLMTTKDTPLFTDRNGVLTDYFVKPTNRTISLSLWSLSRSNLIAPFCPSAPPLVLICPNTL